jgi:hypothetical protein
MRPDPDSDRAGAESEYGDDTGFAAEATRTTPEANTPDDSAGLTAEDDEPAETEDPGTGAD